MNDLEIIVEPLILWYDRKRRILPWRADNQPYHIWVSEIMLQQTRVEAVKPYYLRFIEALPNIACLADCPEDVLMKLWEGLGYYSRVRNMQKAARVIVDTKEGVFPSSYDELLELPGIGTYTAAAIASIAFGKAVPAVDGNVLRVMSRIREDNRDIAAAATKKAVMKDMEPMVPKDRPGIFNQAMMELGAMVCVPNGQPHCMICPIKKYCKAFTNQSISLFPVKKKPAKRRREEKTVLLIMDGSKAILKKRNDSGLLAGLYEFPTMEGLHTADEAVHEAEAHYGVTALYVEPLRSSKHIFTHLEWRMEGYMIRVQPPENRETEDLFVEASDIERNYSVPSAYRTYTGYLRQEARRQAKKDN